MADAKEAIRELRSNRGYVKASITRLCGSCTDSDIEAMLLPNLKVKLTKLESLFTEYEGFSKKLFFLSDSSDDEDYSVVEGKYFSVMAKLQDAIEKKNVPAKHDDSYDAESCSRTKLPTIQMSCFQDTYTARAYQMERDDNMEPKVKDFIEFLEKRALAMENAEPTTSKSSKVVVNVAAQKTSANACLYCNVGKGYSRHGVSGILGD
ncbi:hypothetical protein ABMA27_009280 [Loxostege sticticalis]|uniref:Uncharacterized protein n=1 Tax=Loxostege sticticalis TaxID=481309 RepID=A0ABR3HAI2_LOXSC